MEFLSKVGLARCCLGNLAIHCGKTSGKNNAKSEFGDKFAIPLIGEVLDYVRSTVVFAFFPGVASLRLLSLTML